MGVICTRLLDKGKPRQSRSAPVIAIMRSHRDDAGRLIYQLYYPDKNGADAMVSHHLISPQAGVIADRFALYHGYERDLGTGHPLAKEIIKERDFLNPVELRTLEMLRDGKTKGPRLSSSQDSSSTRTITSIRSA